MGVDELDQSRASDEITLVEVAVYALASTTSRLPRCESKFSREQFPKKARVHDSSPEISSEQIGDHKNFQIMSFP